MFETRTEHDFLGELEIPADIYYGIQTYRALENFQITGHVISSFPEMIQALAYVKKAAAMAMMLGRASVPARLPRSWAPPSIKGLMGMPLRQ